MNELWKLSATELADRFDQGDLRPDDVLEACLARIASVQPSLNAFTHVALESSRAAAEASRKRQLQGRRLGRLDGIPVSVKDNLYVAEMPATWGSRLFEAFVPARDDIPVDRLRRQGAVILGKTNTPEFALAGRTENLLYGLTRNPWNPLLNPGGSSGGAVAGIAAGCCPLALATDAGGSGRLPASFTGVAGMRPSTGKIPRRYGFPPLAPDFQVIAPIARSAQDLQLLLDSIKGPDFRDPLSSRLPPPGNARDPSQIRIRVATRIDEYDGPGGEQVSVDSTVRSHVEAAAQTLRELGYCVNEAAVPYDLQEVREVWRTLSSVGVARVLADFPGRSGEVSQSIAAAAQMGSKVSGVDYVRALDRLGTIRNSVSDHWTDYDVLLTPTAAAPAFPVELPHPHEIAGRPATTLSMSIFTTWVNACGLPALSIPVSPHPDGRPIGMQLVGRFGADEELIAIARHFEAAQPWGQRWPLEDGK